ncbi:MAG: PKD domain-containing protein, partial [Bacteroidota bacterium]
MQNLYRLSHTIFILLLTLCSLQAQDEQFPADTLCLTAGGPGFNVVLDDFPGGLEYFVQAQPTECYRIDDQGNVTVPAEINTEQCCGPQPRFFVSVFSPGSDGQPIFLYRQEVFLEIKCPKPDCGVVDLEEIPLPDSTQNPDIPTVIPCINACENSTATYLFSENPALNYTWSTTNVGATIDPLPGLPGQISITWGPLGPANLSVDIFNGSGTLLNTRSWCVTLTESPVADFTATSVACLDQDVYFTNTSTGAAATYDWDFGDGNTAQNVATPTVAHAYSSPGTYTVTLVATSNGGLNPDGSQACCCVDSVSYDITIDPDPGPGIFWISTLCEGDTSKYWTDATNCTSTSWTVSGNGIPMGPLTNVDTIMVIWNSGPSGTIELSVSGCDSTYCPSPSVAIVPIISSNGVISGPIEVCGGETANYSLPKWVTTTYDWSLPDGGTFNGPTDGHQASITWPTTPGTYKIEVSYGSEFLAGLPGHEGDDCYGTATLEVTVLGNFSLTAAPSPACVDGSTFFNAFSDIGLTTYDWSVDGFPALDAFGQSTYNVNWSALPGPGVYTITASVNNPGDYCVTVKSISVVVKDAVNPVIIGPNDYCIGDPVIYSILSPTPGYTYTWSVTGGSVDAGQFGPTATISFTGATGMVTVVGQDGQAPNCLSDPISIATTAIGFNEPAMVEGPAACTNSLASYSLDSTQHASATYAWSVSPEAAGSVVMGIDMATATIQWNATAGPATVAVDITICGETRTYELDLNLNDPIEPVIIQDGDLCIGGSAMLYIDSTQFTTINWDLGGNAGAVWGPNAGSIVVFDEGNYVVNTIDVNGCPGVDRYRVEAVDGPSVTISAVGARQICVNSPPYPANPVLTATTAAGNTIEWFCGGDSQGPAAIGNTTFTHIWTDSVASFVYFARVVDPATGCTEDSDPLIIRQILCCDTPYIPDPISQLHTFEATRQSPNCDIVDLVATWSPDSVVGHGFSWDFLGASIISFGGDEVLGNDSMTIRLPGVGCFDIFHNIDVWAFDYDTTFTTNPITGQPVIDEIIKVDSIRCGTSLVQTVCNPLFADFDKREECGTVMFTDESEFDLPAPPPPISYTWNFGDGSPTSSDVNPTHTYTANGNYTVTLSITDGDCVSTATMVVEVTDLPDSDFTVSPNPVCYGQPATFTGMGTNVIEWEWDFADGATFNGNGPQHTFLPLLGSGDYDVTLVTTNRAGCRDTVVKTIDVFPTPALDTIEASNGFIICDGDSTVLSVDNIPGLTYLWSTGATTSSITVGTAGMYGVTLTNADGCMQVIEPVEVQVIPLPDASWIGNPFICDNGSTKLTALAGSGHTYTWENQTTGQITSGMMYIVPFSP